MPRSLVVCGCVLGCAFAAPAHASSELQDLGLLSIEELAQIPVSSASKREEPLSTAPAALYVITGDEIVASGSTSLPEVLRLAPNLQVQQVTASEYAISARGFNGPETANKLLVLIDGRTIYTPLASTVFWNLHQPLLEDIRQIEVISGPGGTLYGPNAVNGVVNITTRDALETIGTMARGTVGPEELTAAIRHGMAIGDSGAVRFYANWHDRDGLPGGVAPDSDDDYSGWQAGFRSDFVNEADHFTFQGDVLRTQSDVAEGDGGKAHNLLARWSRVLSPTSSFQVQGHYDWFKREFVLVEDSVETFDAEAQLNSSLGAHEVVIGAGVRTTRDEFINNLNIFQLDPISRRLWTYNAFAQDRVNLTDQLSLTAGVKVERSSFTGWHVLPNARLAWQPGDTSLLWAAVSRAVRTPSRIDRELAALPILAKGMDFDSEKLVALEAGYRGQPSSRLSVSVNGFLNFYDDIRTTEFTDGGLPIQLRNGIEGRSWGVEAWGNAQVAPGWRLSLGAATIWKDFEVKEGRTDLANLAATGDDPTYKLMASSDFQITPKLHLTVHARGLDGIDRDPRIDGYVEAGGRLAYQLTEEVELFLAGRNLLHEDHAESNYDNQAQLATRSIYAGARVRY